MDYLSLLQQIKNHPNFSSWSQSGQNKYRDYKNDTNPKVELSVYGLYDHGERRVIQSLHALGKELGIVQGRNGKEKIEAGGEEAGGETFSGDDGAAESLSDETKKEEDRIEKIFTDSRGWKRESLPVLLNYFLYARGIEKLCGELGSGERRAGIEKLGRILWRARAYVRRSEREGVESFEIRVPMFSVSGQVVQVLRVPIEAVNVVVGGGGGETKNKRRWQRVAGPSGVKKTSFKCVRDRWGIVEDSRSDSDPDFEVCETIWVVEGFEDAVTLAMVGKNARFVCGTSGLGHIEEVIKAEIGAEVRVLLDRDKEELWENPGLRATAALGLGENVQRLIPGVGPGGELKIDANGALRAGGEAGLRRWIRGLELVGWQEVLEWSRMEETKDERLSERDPFELHRVRNPLSDAGAAKYFVLRFGDRVRVTEDGRVWAWCEELGVWSVEHGKGRVRAWIAGLAHDYEKLAGIAEKEGDKERAAEVRKFARSLGAAGRQSAVMQCLGAEASICVSVEEFDSRADILNVKNGILMLETGELVKHSANFMCSRICGVEWRGGDPYVQGCQRFDQFLEEICCGDRELVGYKLRQWGYLISGYTSEKAVFFHYGESGNNGKSVEAEVLEYVLGDYARTVSPGLLVAAPGGGYTSEEMYALAELPGVRLAVMGETDETKAWSESAVKRCSGGGDRVVARQIRERGFSYRPQFKVVVHGNNRPRIKTGDKALWSRFHLIPYDFIPEEIDAALADKLKLEASGVLARLWQGFREWRAVGLGAERVERMREAKADYKEEIVSDVEEWLADCCLVTPSRKEKASALYTSYTTYCKKTLNKLPKSSNAVGRVLTELGITAMKVDGVRFRSGIALKIFEDELAGNENF